ncbi:Hypothetical protein CUL131002_1741 [Corynebacterium ulcerans]|nr:Hypothetical protein CUL131002_1741 [Corynebacterium ulcerans]
MPHFSHGTSSRRRTHIVTPFPTNAGSQQPMFATLLSNPNHQCVSSPSSLAKHPSLRSLPLLLACRRPPQSSLRASHKTVIKRPPRNTF